MRAEIIFLLYFYYILFYFNTTLQWGIVKYQKFKFRQRDLSFTGSQVFHVKKLKTSRASDWRRFYHFLWDFVLFCPTFAVFSLAYKSLLVNSFALAKFQRKIVNPVVVCAPKNFHFFLNKKPWFLVSNKSLSKLYT